jgi:exopolysaccharide biosynthesis polyprenyl glycosylphosphotransferase
MVTVLAEEASIPRVLPRGLQPSEHRALLAAGDAAAATAAVIVALWLWSIPAGWTFSAGLVTSHAWWFLAAVLWLMVAAVPAAPSSIAFSLRQTLAVLTRGAAILLIAYGAWYFSRGGEGLPRLVVLYFLWEATLLTLVWRLIFVTVFSRQRFRQRAIIIGSGSAAALALSTIRRHRARQVDVVGIVPEAAEADDAANVPRDVARIDGARLLEVAAERGASELVLALREPPSEALLKTLLLCQEAGAQVVRVQTLTEQILHRVPVDLLEPDWLMTDLADAVRLGEASWLAKRLLDVAGAALGLLVFALATPFIAVAVWLDSGSPIFYRQARVGRGGVLFTVLKFRTMRRDAERPGEARWADRDDPRMTRVGRWLRRTRLDELPQFANILRGEMSLVGPRPERLEFIGRLQEEIPFYRARLMVPPGLTGWAQVNLPYGDSVEAARAKLEYDLYYVKHRSVTFDLAIVLRTIGIVARLGGH